MTNKAVATWRFVSRAEAEIEQLPGKTHHWYVRPDMVSDSNLMFVRAILPPGEAHRFHYHPKMEEILYVLSGTAEQWVERDRRSMKPGDSLYLPSGIIHGTYNAGNEPLEFLAVLSPAKAAGPVTIEVSDQEPWKSLRS
ncbi:MAG TPA: cupin domain-containing protein [Candidatus Nitrosotalea sp.]|nr:cupin domain-containing protein [Candidatus Nitrosotalea sp.]